MDPIEAAEAPSPIMARAVRLVAPGSSPRAFLAVPKGAEWRSAVVVVGDTFDVDAHASEVARRLARAGHGVLAVGHGAVGSEGALDADLVGAVNAGLARLRAEAPAPPARVGVVGYGLGGFVALVAGYRCQVGAAVSLYGAGPMRLRADLRRIIDRPKRHSAPLLCLLGVEDVAVRAEDLAAIRERLDAFGMRHTFIIYPRTRSGFCRPDGADFRPKEADDAWRRVLHALETAPRLRNRSPPKRAK
jgi:carboxymethylenebutenolidase